MRIFLSLYVEQSYNEGRMLCIVISAGIYHLYFASTSSAIIVAPTPISRSVFVSPCILHCSTNQKYLKLRVQCGLQQPPAELPPALWAHFTSRKCLLWGKCAIISPSLQRNVLDELHSLHCGVARTKELFRSYVWWPRINHDIESWVSSCSNCQQHCHQTLQVLAGGVDGIASWRRVEFRGVDRVASWTRVEFGIRCWRVCHRTPIPTQGPAAWKPVVRMNVYTFWASCLVTSCFSFCLPLLIFTYILEGRNVVS